MTPAATPPTATALQAGLTEPDPATRLQAALAAGMRPDPDFVDVLIQRCGVEPDFYVRDMLTWALTRHPRALTVPQLVDELGRDATQPRSQALHTLSKIGDRGAWPAVTTELLHDHDDEVARAAWRAAVVLVPDGRERELARELTAELGQGGRERQLSLSRALATLGDPARGPVSDAAAQGDERVRAHALVTERFLDDPEESFESAVHEAQRIMALAGAPRVSGTAPESSTPDEPDGRLTGGEGSSRRSDPTAGRETRLPE